MGFLNAALTGAVVALLWIARNTHRRTEVLSRANGKRLQAQTIFVTSRKWSRSPVTRKRETVAGARSTPRSNRSVGTCSRPQTRHQHARRMEGKRMTVEQMSRQ